MDDIFYVNEKTRRQYTMRIILRLVKSNLMNYILQNEENAKDFFHYYCSFKRYSRDRSRKKTIKAFKIFEKSLSPENKLLLEICKT